MERQGTVGRAFTLEGVGVHSGERVRVTVEPAPESHGIVFVRADLGGDARIPASLESVRHLRRGTALGLGDGSKGSDRSGVGTVEHLLAALHAAGVDNALARVEGPELPILDGSFAGFAEAIEEAGVRELDAAARLLRLKAPFSWKGGRGECYTALPAEELELVVSIDYPHPLIGRQARVHRLADFRTEIAPARTFGFVADAERLRADGLALGSSAANAVLLGGEGEPAPPLRFADEFVRHKAGDLLGDLALLGGRLHARIVAERPGHRANVEFARRLARELELGARRPLLDVSRIMMHLPHRYPMLLVDRITAHEPGRSITGIKNVTINEAFFQGHYPGHPVMPGVLIVEAMAQVGGLLLMDEVEAPEDKVVYFMSLDKVKWRRPVVPGDTVVFELELISFRGRNCRMRGRGYVEGVLVAQAELMARIVDR